MRGDGDACVGPLATAGHCGARAVQSRLLSSPFFSVKGRHEEGHSGCTD